MKLQQLGNTDLQIPPIVFGGNVFGWTLNEQESFDMLDRLLDAGFNTIDTADTYVRWAEGNEGGESETIIGKWLTDRKVRDQVNIITKVGGDMGQGQTDLSEEYILQEAEASLDRLQIEQIDLYLTHYDDESTPIEETLGAYRKLVDAGKVKYIGASNLSPERLSKSLKISHKHDLPRYEVFQPEYNIYDRQKFEEGAGVVAEKEGLGVIPYYALAAGFLTGKYRSDSDTEGRKRAGMVQKYLNDRGYTILNTLDKVAEKHDISQAGVALAWLINRPVVSAPIASATKESHLEAFMEAIETELDEEDMHQLNEISS